MWYFVCYLINPYLFRLLKVSMCVGNKPPQNGEGGPAEEEAECAEAESIAPPHVDDSRHAVLDKAPFVLSHVTWVQVAGTIFEYCPVVVLLVVCACGWWGVLSYRHSGILNHL